MAEFLMKPKIDFAFKEIMANEKARIGFLATMLKVNPEDIKETTLLNTSILDFELFDDAGVLLLFPYCGRYPPYTLYTDKMEFHILELPKLPEELKDDSDNILL